MTDEKLQLVVGCLLHDIGKVIYRKEDKRRHSISGYEFLKNEMKISESSVLESVRYHHGQELRNASIKDDSFAYITYIADNIASAADRRKNDAEDYGFEITAPLEPVFNVLNGNNEKMFYHPSMLEESAEINYPTSEKKMFDEFFYSKVVQVLRENLTSREWSEEYLNSLLSVLESTLTYVPSSTAKDELADISLFDHVKITAAVGSCIYDYLESQKITDYRTELLDQATSFYNTNAFLLVSMDISGIQQFIYNIQSEGALQMLRARSFYLELLMEHIIDELLERCEQSRSNLLYVGGGHCYLLLANTKKTVDLIEHFIDEINQWMLDTFETELYIAIGAVPCSANELKNIPQGSYADMFKQMGKQLSLRKGRRYTADQIIKLNRSRVGDQQRECAVCKRVGHLNAENRCPVCSDLVGLSKNILYTNFFSVCLEGERTGLELPFGKVLRAEKTEKSLRETMNRDCFVRAYSKNNAYTGKGMVKNLFVGNYTTGETFEELAKQAVGIERIGILRADIDNLGSTFVSGFEQEKRGDYHVSISRTATLSRQLSLFFKYHINKILSNPDYTLDGQEKTQRKASIVYSGGDDLFIVGAWDDVIELAIDIQHDFEKYTESTLTISGGIGIYQPKYPIHVIADEVEDLESESKERPGKNAITILPDGQVHELDSVDGVRQIDDGTYIWSEFVENVLEEKYRAIAEYFDFTQDHGKGFLYHLLELIRNQGQKINLARYIYLLARMEPDQKAADEEKLRYKIFSKRMYQWIQSPKDCRELKTAMTIYVYRTRERQEE